MKILVTGKYDPTYNRTLILLSGLKKNGVTLIELPLSGLSAKDKVAVKKAATDCDLVYLPPFTHADVRRIKKWTNKPVVFDPLISKYLTKVFDYKLVWKYSPRALKNFYKDKFPFQASDLLISDTFAHAEFYSNTFGISRSKIEVVEIGADTDAFSPQVSANKETGLFRVGFYGGFIPLQGVRTILEAAEILKGRPVMFEMVGDGFEYIKSKAFVQQNKLKNITFHGRAAYKDLPAIINSFDICLGIFGHTPKAELVIPNKVFHYCSCGKYTITRDSRAIREVFEDGKNIALIKPNPQSLAEKILEAINSPEKVESIGKKARETIHLRFNDLAVGKKFIHAITKAL